MRIELVVDNRVRLRNARALPPECLRKLEEEFTHRNPARAAKERLGLPAWSEPREYKTFAWEADVLTFPRGGLNRVRKILDDFDVDRAVEDRRSRGADLPDGIPDYMRELWPHQVKLRDAAIEAECCILKAATGAGKSSCGFAIAATLKVSTLVIVPNRALFDQWLHRAGKELGLNRHQVGVIQGARRRLKPLTIAIQKTLASKGVDEELANFFGLVIYDEVQLAAAPTCFAAVDPFKARYRIGISADHRRRDRREFLIYDLFGGVAAEAKRSALVASGHVLDVEVRIVPTNFEAPWYGIAETKEDEKDIDFSRLLAEMTEDSARNDLVLWCLEQERGEQALVMSHRREHCRVLDALISSRIGPTGLFIGGDDYRQAFVETRERFEAGDLCAAVGTYQAVGMGIDLPKAAVGVATTPIASNRQMVTQAVGRVGRGGTATGVEGKTGARFYVLWDRAVFPNHLRNLTQWVQTARVWDGIQWVDGKTYARGLRKAGASAEEA